MRAHNLHQHPADSGEIPREAVDLIRRKTSQRRGKGQTRGDSALLETHEGTLDHWLADPACTPELAATVADEIRRLFGLLGTSDLQALATAKMEGYANQELADKFQCSQRTIERRLHLIREIWESERSP